MPTAPRTSHALQFLLLSEEEAAPVKAVDFGLAIFFDPAHLPVTGLNPEGTPWYLAPECCRAKWWPASDVWAVGVMACYLLSGAYPFLDRLTPKMPDLARTLRRCGAVGSGDVVGCWAVWGNGGVLAFLSAELSIPPFPPAASALRNWTWDAASSPACPPRPRNSSRRCWSKTRCR